MTEKIHAYAKINLHLDICSKRADGYHDVELVMQSMSLCDIVGVTLRDDGGFICKCNRADVPSGDENIAVRAAKLFAQKSGKCNGASIEIEKNIPMAAGLAGGSTDAAAVLVALNRLCDFPFGEHELCELGAALGADVPFCICGGTAFTDGRGDVLHEFPQLSDDLYFIIACGNESVSTPWAYRLLDIRYNDFKDYAPVGVQELKNGILGEDKLEFCKYIFNIFEQPILEERPEAKKIKEMLLQSGAIAAMMSGSGPSVFAVFDNKASAKKAEECIRALDEYFFVCTAMPTNKRAIR